jgi:hypothetical protein
MLPVAFGFDLIFRPAKLRVKTMFGRGCHDGGRLLGV